MIKSKILIGAALIVLFQSCGETESAKREEQLSKEQLEMQEKEHEKSASIVENLEYKSSLKGINFKENVNSALVSNSCDFLTKDVIEKTFGETVSEVENQDHLCVYNMNDNKVTVSFENEKMDAFSSQLEKIQMNRYTKPTSNGIELLWMDKGELHLFLHDGSHWNIDVSKSGQITYANAKSIAERLLDNLPKK